MAKKEDADAPRGRLLFTDFAISQKGRPPALSLPRIAAGPTKPLSTLRDIISSLGINFEDDDDDRSPPDFSPPPDDDRREDDAGPDSAFEAPIEDGPESDPESASGEPDPAMPPDGFPAAFMPGDETGIGVIRRGSAVQGDDAWLGFDFASLPIPRAKIKPDDPPFPPKGGEAAGASSSAAEADAAGGALSDIGPEDDILSLVSPEGGETTGLPAGRKMTRTWVPPPRSTPYGGLERVENWYVPPERNAGAEHSGHPDRVEDWYEPPESVKQSAAESAEKTATPGSADELFGDVDIDAAWQARTALENANRMEADAADDLFAEFANLLGRLPGHTNTASIAPPVPAIDAAREDSDILSEVTPEESARFRQARLEAAEVEDAFPDAEAEPGFIEEKTLPQTRDRPPPESAAQYRSEPENALPAAETRTDIRVSIDFADDDGQAGAHSRDVAAVASSVDEPFADGSGTVTAGEPSAALAAKDDEEAGEEPVSSSAGAIIGLDEPPADSAAEAENGGAEKTDAPAGPPPAALSGMEDSGENIDAGDPDPLAEAVGGGPANHSIFSPDAADGGPDMGTGRFREDAASEDDYLPGSGGAPGDGGAGGSESADSNAEKETGEEEVAVNPMDVFANMDALDDFGDDSLDDEMRAMLDDGGEEERKEKDAPAGEAAAMPPSRETSRIGRIMAKIAGKLPMEKIRQITALLAWRENWWFYCDLIAAIIATASLAVIASYFMWYR